MPEVALAWGSQSTKSVRRPSSARQADRFIAVVVFPTPPFWLTMPRILPMAFKSKREERCKGRRLTCGEQGEAVESSLWGGPGSNGQTYEPEELRDGSFRKGVRTGETFSRWKTSWIGWAGLRFLGRVPIWS